MDARSTSASVDDGQSARTAPQAWRRTLLRGMLLVVVAASIAAALLIGFRLGSTERPDDDSAEAGFLRDMQVHHAQAVGMSMMVRDRTEDPEVRRLAFDIALGQQQQIGQMYALLRSWNLSQVPRAGHMTWMSGGADGGHDMSGMEMDDGGVRLPTAPMPGMAAATQLEQFAASSDLDAERQFLELMIEHHRGGVEMAQAALGAVEIDQVRELADSMQQGQQAEIRLMRQMLEERDAR